MDTKKRPVTAPLLCDLSSELEGRYFSRICVGANRDVLLLSTEKENIGPYLRLEKTASFRIHHWHDGTTREVDLPPSDRTFYIVTPMKGNYLCVAANAVCEERNAYLFNSEGNLLHSYNLGCSIADVQISPNNQIWVAYADDGIFGMEEEESSSQGLVCFDALGHRTFGFWEDLAKNPSNKVDRIYDCYALNVVSDHDVWLCYYTEFPLVHLRDRKVEAIFQPPPQVIGSNSFAVCDTRRLFDGGYHYGGQIFWRDEASGRQVEIEAVNEAGECISWNRIYGRDADLFLCDEAKIYVLALNEISF